jgi:hypothetical protein
MIATSDPALLQFPRKLASGVGNLPVSPELMAVTAVVYVGRLVAESMEHFEILD